jgi:hypothetical protein
LTARRLQWSSREAAQTYGVYTTLGRFRQSAEFAIEEAEAQPARNSNRQKIYRTIRSNVART